MVTKKNFMRVPQPLQRLIPLFVFIFSFTIAWAQNGTIKGVVRDERGPLAGASVTVAGKGIGTTTDENGVYELQVAPGRYTIAISYVVINCTVKELMLNPMKHQFRMLQCNHQPRVKKS